MSWTQSFRKYWAGAPLSPLSHPGQSRPAQQVQDKDFSYITSEDLAQHRPARSADQIAFKHNKTTYKVSFPGYAIDDGTLTIGAARAEAARALNITDPRRIRMFYKGKTLKDNAVSCLDEGLISAGPNDILCVVGDALPDDSGESGSDDDDEDDGAEDSPHGSAGPTSSGNGGGKKKKRRTKRKKAKKTNSSGGGGPSGNVEHLPIPTGTHPTHRSGTSSVEGATPRQPSPATPLTPMAKLLDLSRKLRDDLAPKAAEFMAHPPSEPSKREFEHKRLTETILTQVLIKLDGVETEGDQDARMLRKELVREAQGWLNKLDDNMKG